MFIIEIIEGKKAHPGTLRFKTVKHVKQCCFLPNEEIQMVLLQIPCARLYFKERNEFHNVMNVADRTIKRCVLAGHHHQCLTF